ncbi:MAG: PD40 domain-containing protein [Myxococcales bacterium]|nr:PD40 domain-containing protein [Myxococcales bacterium]
MKFRPLSVFVPLALVALAPVLSAQTRPAADAGVRGTPGEGPEQEITIQNLDQRLLPIAIPAIAGSVGGDVSNVLVNDLRLSALFRVVDAARYPSSAASEGMTINAQAWVPVGATSVVKAATTGSGDASRLELKVWEPSRPAAPVLERTFGPASPRSLAHQVANALIRHYTGRDGVFGSRILFARRTGRARKDVFTVEMDGANLAMISPGRRLNMLPAWGPNGIYYAAQTREGFIHLVRASRPNAVPVVQVEGMVAGSSFCGGRMAISINREGNPEIYVGSADGSNLRRATNNSAADVSPVFNSGCSQIAFVSDRDGSPQVYVMSADGGGQRRVTFTGDYNQTPSWSPDGTTIAYASRQGGSFDIFTVAASGGRPRRLTEGQGSNTDPTFSPDGRLIAFNSSRGGIWLMNKDGLAQTQILAGGGESLRWEPR